MMKALSLPKCGWSVATSLVLTSLVIAPSAYAHPGHGMENGFSGGFLHPLTGWDHLGAMIALGLWAASLGGRARWVVPGSFLGAMALGAAWGHAVGAVPGTEQAIAASVFVLGLMIASAMRPPVLSGAALAGAFALFHGFAHGAEMPAGAQGLACAGGFLLASACLLATGFALGAVVWRRSPFVHRLAGGLIAASALVLFAQS
jgi:urease accessory protein